MSGDQQQPSAWGGKVVGGSAALVLALAGAHWVAQEGMVLETYADPVHGWAVPTACAGETGPHVKRGMVFTLDECMALLARTHGSKVQELLPCIARPVTVLQFVALLDLAGNVGARPVCQSTMLRLHNAGSPPQVWCRQFTEAWSSYVPHGLPIEPANYVREPIGWVRAGSRNCRDPRNNCRGIVRRREEAQQICLGDPSPIAGWADIAAQHGVEPDEIH